MRPILPFAFGMLLSSTQPVTTERGNAMLWCDTEQFDALAEALAAACLHCRDGQGLLVAPPHSSSLDAVVMAVLTGLMGDNVTPADRVHLGGWPMVSR
jgi:hypothetical protein